MLWEYGLQMKELSKVVLAPAKINLALAVTTKRTDGFHGLQTVFQTISLLDRVRVTLKNQGIVCYCGDLSGEKNLAYKAAQLFLEQYQTMDFFKGPLGVEIEIEKNIPVQAGLAGGSSNAAAVLRAMNSLLSNPFTQETLLGIARKCGSDTAFCLKGGTQWGEGTGTDLTELPPAPEMDILVVKPSQGISTAAAYRIFDEIGEYSTLSKELWVDLLKTKEIKLIGRNLTNSLEKAAIRFLPKIARIKDLLLQGGCYGALLSGSGSAVFGIVQDRQQGTEIAEQLRTQGFVNTWLVKTINDQNFK
jgi:4-diphosphocytidyl-2-C-methyl-D-erythritol kinase